MVMEMEMEMAMEMEMEMEMGATAPPRLLLLQKQGRILSWMKLQLQDLLSWSQQWQFH
jgi:hypothetical protein